MTHRLWNVYQMKYLIYAERLENWGLISHINSIFGDFYNFMLENWIIFVSTDGNFTRYEWKCQTHWVLCICLHLGVEIEVYYSIIFHEKWHHLFRIKNTQRKYSMGWKQLWYNDKGKQLIFLQHKSKKG